MYDTKYECRYYKDSVFLDTDQVNDDEKNYIRNILYREDLLNIFDLNGEMDENDIFGTTMSKLYDKLKTNRELCNCMIVASSNVMCEDELVGLCILYSYDYMYLTHDYVSKYLENGTNDKILLMQLERKLKE